MALAEVKDESSSSSGDIVLRSSSSSTYSSDTDREADKTESPISLTGVDERISRILLDGCSLEPHPMSSDDESATDETKEALKDPNETWSSLDLNEDFLSSNVAWSVGHIANSVGAR